MQTDCSAAANIIELPNSPNHKKLSECLQNEIMQPLIHATKKLLLSCSNRILSCHKYDVVQQRTIIKLEFLVLFLSPNIFCHVANSMQCNKEPLIVTLFKNILCGESLRNGYSFYQTNVATKALK